ncbi:MAG: glycoside hydrolase family 97 N-terminal domain-containing protein [Ignavibacteriae bacterium]|nr:glycoside hydrolase family 97 N-terminal domain-containing protein [Ignavibacteriota bacterium]
MKRVARWIVATLCVLSLRAPAQEEVRLSSPGGQCEFTFRMMQGVPQYAVSFKGKALIGYSSLRLWFSDGGLFGNRLVMGTPAFEEVDTAYTLIVGKASRVPDRYREVRIPLEEGGGAHRQIIVVARAFDDGIAFRYDYPRQDGWLSYALTEERSDFNITGNPTLRTLFLRKHTT